MNTIVQILPTRMQPASRLPRECPLRFGSRSCLDFEDLSDAHVCEVVQNLILAAGSRDELAWMIEKELDYHHGPPDITWHKKGGMMVTLRGVKGGCITI